MSGLSINMNAFIILLRAIPFVPARWRPVHRRPSEFFYFILFISVFTLSTPLLSCLFFYQMHHRVIASPAVQTFTLADPRAKCSGTRRLNVDVKISQRVPAFTLQPRSISTVVSIIEKMLETESLALDNLTNLLLNL